MIPVLLLTGVIGLSALYGTCGPEVHPATTQAIIEVESKGNPLAIHDNDTGVSYAPSTRTQAVEIATRLLNRRHSIDLEGMAGVALSGYAGMKDKVDNHHGKLITGVILSSMLSAGAKVAAGNNDVGTATFSQQATSGAAQQVSTVGAKFADRNLNVQPTIEIRPGMKFNVFVNKDLILKHYRT